MATIYETHTYETTGNVMNALLESFAIIQGI